MDKMSWLDYAKAIVETEDLDPVYCMLQRANLPEKVKSRFVLGYLMFYDSGTASALCEFEGNKWWKVVYEFYPSFRRGSPRRHFRGQAGLEAITALKSFTPNPDDFMYLIRRSTYMGVRQAIIDSKIPQFGNYFIWKLADIQDRVFGWYCNFSGARAFLSPSPIAGLRLIARQLRIENISLDAICEKALSVLNHWGLVAPPRYERELGLQELETIACGYQGYVRGTDYVGKSINQEFQSLIRIKNSNVAKEVMRHIPSLPSDNNTARLL